MHGTSQLPPACFCAGFNGSTWYWSTLGTFPLVLEGDGQLLQATFVGVARGGKNYTWGTVIKAVAPNGARLRCAG